MINGSLKIQIILDRSELLCFFLLSEIASILKFFPNIVVCFLQNHEFKGHFDIDQVVNYGEGYCSNIIHKHGG